MLRFEIWKRNKACCHLPKSASFQAIRVLNFIIDAKKHCLTIILNAHGLTLAPFLPRHACARGLSSSPLFRGPTSVLAWVRPRVPSNLPPATGIADDRRPNPRGLMILISILQLPFFPSWGTVKRSRLRSDLTMLGLSKAHNLCRRGNRHHHPPTLTHGRYTLGVTRRHGTCDPLADRATFVLLLVVPIFLCRGVQFVRLHCDVGRAWALGCLALPGLEALLPSFPFLSESQSC